MDALLTQANDLIGKVWPVVVAVVGAGLAIRIFKNSLQKRFEFHSGALVAPLLKQVTMKRKILILSAVLISSFSHAESWESITKSTYQSSAYAESKQITNQDGSKTTVYYIDAAMQASACQGAKSSAQSVFTRVKPTYEGIWPDSEFRLVFTGDCTYSDSPGRRINIGL